MAGSHTACGIYEAKRSISCHALLGFHSLMYDYVIPNLVCYSSVVHDELNAIYALHMHSDHKTRRNPIGSLLVLMSRVMCKTRFCSRSEGQVRIPHAVSTKRSISCHALFGFHSSMRHIKPSFVFVLSLTAILNDVGYYSVNFTF